MDIIDIVVVIGVILVSMTLHELMHAVTAYWLGDQTPKAQGRISLNPARHIDPFLTVLLPLMIITINVITHTNNPIFGGAKPVQLNPLKIRHGDWGMALVALVGPLMNFILAFISFAAAMLFKDVSGAVYEIMVLSTTVNLGFFVFNMLPIPPLDGSRVLYALAPDFVRRGMDMIERAGLIVIFMIVMLLNAPIMMIIRSAIQAILQGFAWVFGVTVA